MPRFELGTQVTILETISSLYAGQEGRITQVIVHKRGNYTLDKYEVEFAAGEKCVFWDIQLAVVNGRTTEAVNPCPVIACIALQGEPPVTSS